MIHSPGYRWQEVIQGHKQRISMEARLLTLALITVAIRLFGNASVVILTGLDPRPVAVRKRLLAWLVSLGAAGLAMLLAPVVSSL
ncbi:putative membrane protein [Synechococcus sp. MIT S9220]|uniref:hypothetical protein n=1 Tax=unclassified Synechococcus TaxID=2626047 RepID=UPI00164BB469|nr:hypothetical protein [Synechococcus sp. MIT S9220]NOL46647.1 hypothetical protein [Synechococcus sp. MIT S9220]QNJ23200.1 putative membrane protein [Synechococcus sp. MIT S9220]